MSGIRASCCYKEHGAWLLVKECHKGFFMVVFLLADDPLSAEQFHQEYNPPVEGSYTGMNKLEKIVPVTDPSNDREQVQQRFVYISSLCSFGLAVNSIVITIKMLLTAIQTDNNLQSLLFSEAGRRRGSSGKPLNHLFAGLIDYLKAFYLGNTFGHFWDLVFYYML